MVLLNYEILGREKKLKIIQVILVLSLVLLTSCNNSQDSIDKTDQSAFEKEKVSIEKKIEEEKLLEELRQEYEKLPRPIKVLRAIDENIGIIEDEELKNEYIKLANDAFEKTVKNTNDNYSIAKESAPLKEVYNLYSKYLYDDVKQNVRILIDTSLKAGDVISMAVEKMSENELIVEELQEYNQIKVGDWRPDVVTSIKEKNLDYEFLCPNQPCSFMSVSNRVIVFDGLSVDNIIVMKDSNGVIVNPLEMEILVDYAEKYSILEAEKQEMERNELAKKKQEQLENQKVKIGMTKEEVLSRWGKPQDVNRTITEYSTMEQWVYPNYNYLYFENGILTTIQN